MAAQAILCSSDTEGQDLVLSLQYHPSGARNSTPLSAKHYASSSAQRTRTGGATLYEAPASPTSRKPKRGEGLPCWTQAASLPPRAHELVLEVEDRRLAEVARHAAASVLQEGGLHRIGVRRFDGVVTGFVPLSQVTPDFPMHCRGGNELMEVTSVESCHVVL